MTPQLQILLALNPKENTMYKSLLLTNLFKRDPAPTKAAPPVECKHNPLDLGNGFGIKTVDDFAVIVATVDIPAGGYISFKYAGREVFRIDQYGGKNV